MTTHLPENLRYTDTHEWVRIEGDGSCTIGLTDHAQQLLGDIVFVELPERGAQIDANVEVGVVESVKTASDIYNPIAGKIIEINDILNTEAALINSDPYGNGWLYRLMPATSADVDALLSASAYEESLSE